MGITKRAVTVIGVRVPRDKISHIVDKVKNLCTCSPQTADVGFCPKCGMNLTKEYSSRVLNDDVPIEEEDYVAVTMHGYPIASCWREDKHIYIGAFISSTEPAYSAEGADPVRCPFSAAHIDVAKFETDMKEYGLWDEKEFGIWTIMLLE